MLGENRLHTVIKVSSFTNIVRSLSLSFPSKLFTVYSDVMPREMETQTGYIIGGFNSNNII